MGLTTSFARKQKTMGVAIEMMEKEKQTLYRRIS